MRKSILVLILLVGALALFQSCSTNPEKSLLSSYFHAVTLNDNDTMSSMAIEPIQVDLASWQILNVSPETVEPAKLPDLNAKELELKKAVEDHVGPTVAAKDELDAAKERLDLERTAAGKAAARKQVEQLQAVYDREYQKHKELQQAYNDAKAASAREEEMTAFSLGVRELPTIRDLTGDVHSKTVDVLLRLKNNTERKYKIHLKKYVLKDEAARLSHNGRWVIIQFEPVS